MRAKAEISGVFAAFSSVGLVLVGGVRGAVFKGSWQDKEMGRMEGARGEGTGSGQERPFFR
jgi:hypothetical protein